MGYKCYNLLINGIHWGYNPLINLLLTSWDIQVVVCIFVVWRISSSRAGEISNEYIQTYSMRLGWGCVYLWRHGSLICMVNYISHTIHIWYIILFPYIYHKNQPNVGKYTIHGWYGYSISIHTPSMDMSGILGPINCGMIFDPQEGVAFLLCKCCGRNRKQSYGCEGKL